MQGGLWVVGEATAMMIMKETTEARHTNDEFRQQKQEEKEEDHPWRYLEEQSTGHGDQFIQGGEG